MAPIGHLRIVAILAQACATVLPLHTLIALSPLEPRYIPLIIAALAVWLFLVRFFLRQRQIEHLQGVGTGQAVGVGWRSRWAECAG